jgi:flavodoxin I
LIYEKIGIFYGSTTGNTESIAKKIHAQLSESQLKDVARVKVEELANYENIIFGTSTWNTGELQDDWGDFLSKVANADLSGKVVALFGLGDSSSYADTFVNGMGEIYQTIKDKDCKIVGQVETSDYDFVESEAVIEGKFIGLAIDEDNEDNKTDSRIKNWIEKIKHEFV